MPHDPSDHHTRLALLEDWRERTDATLAELRDSLGKILSMQAEAAGVQKSTDRTLKFGLAILGLLISGGTLFASMKR